MTTPRLTIGMAHHEDFYGLWATLQSLAFHNPADVEDVEFVVVENSPPGEHRDAARALVQGNMGFGTAGARYVELPDSSGTTRTRQAIFDHATSDNVLVMDCHVFLATGAISRLKRWFDENPDTRAILSGPMAYDDRKNLTTHFHNEWRGQMWGTWARAWRCPCGAMFSLFERDGRAVFCTLELEHREVEHCACGRAFPRIAWYGHEALLTEAGFRAAAAELDEEPFEIPGMGMGLFAARKSDWPGFIEEAAGFGGEELCVHEAMRQAGGVALCLPFLRWLHRFPRPGGPRYPLMVESKVRNYVLWFRRLGRPLDEIHQHFVLDNAFMTPEAWERLVRDPVGFTDGIPGAAAAAGQGRGAGDVGRPQPAADATLDEAFAWCQTIHRDLDQHLELLRDLGSRVDQVTVITKRREAALGFLAGRPAELIVYDREVDPLYQRLQEWAETEAVHLSVTTLTDFDLPPIESTELLFLDTVHSAEQLRRDLAAHGAGVRRFLVIRGTGAFGERAEGDAEQPGLLHALREWLRENPEWFVVHHTAEQYGMTVLGCDPEDRPDEPLEPEVVALFADPAPEPVPT